MSSWLLVSGEFPPDSGGVADYTSLLARGLAERGHEVHVAAPESPAGPGPRGPYRLHSLRGGFGPAGLKELSQVVSRVDPQRLFVQYVPHAYGYKALNFGLCAWLLVHSRSREVWTQFHEVAFPFVGPPWRKTHVLALGHRAMAALVCRASARRFVTTRRWEPLLAPWGGLPATHLPVPSNVGTDLDPQARGRWRGALGLDAQATLVGHFGTYGRLLSPLLRATIPSLLAEDPRVHVLLLGRRGTEFRQRLRADAAWLGRRVHALGERSGSEVGAAIQACDLMLQPYEDGVTSRRGSLMASLALAAPVLTTREARTDPAWERGAVALSALDPGALARHAQALLSQPDELQALGQRGRALYEAAFSLERTLDRLES